MSVRLLHADIANVLADLESESVDLVLCDPPYNSMNQHLKLGSGRIVGDGSEEQWFREWSDDPRDFTAFLVNLHRVMKPQSCLFMMFDPTSLLKLGGIVDLVFDTKNVITWDKVNMGMGYHFRRRSEFIIYATKGGAKLTSKGIPDVWQIKKVHRPLYPTSKPVQLYEQMIEATLGHAGDAIQETRIAGQLVRGRGPATILDPFMGSGGSALAAREAGHHYIGVDVSAEAHEITQRRLDAAADGQPSH